MADTKISALPASTTPLAGTEVLPIVQSSATKQVSVANLTAGRAISATQLTLTTGNLIVASGQGIDFSATAGTGTSELLADYEEGTWTVTDASGAGLTLVTATGFYTKIGRVVYWQANVDYPVTADVSSSLLGGLPFTISSGLSPGRSGSFITAITVASVVQTLQLSPTNVRLYKTGFVRATNAELSGCTIYLAGFFVV